MTVRPRRGSDLERCATVLREVHERDGYPKIWPADPEGWLAGHDVLEAWVAVDGEAIVGHVLLHEIDPARTWPQWLAATGRAPDRLTVMSRFFVVAAARGTDAAPALMAQARAHARANGLGIVLEVADHSAAALAFYARHGWSEVGAGVIPIAGGSAQLPVLLLVDGGPPRDSESARRGSIAGPSGE